jgi:hypothetical protein
MNNSKKTQLKYQKKSILSVIIGIINLIILVGVWSLYAAWEGNFFEFLLPLKRIFYSLVGGTTWEFSCFFIPLLSSLGIFLGVGSLKSSYRKIAIFGIVLNSINLFFSLFLSFLIGCLILGICKIG